MDFHGLSWTIMEDHGLSRTDIDDRLTYGWTLVLVKLLSQLKSWKGLHVNVVKEIILLSREIDSGITNAQHVFLFV